MKYDRYGRSATRGTRPSRTDARRRVRRSSVGTGRRAERIAPARVVARAS